MVVTALGARGCRRATILAALSSPSEWSDWGPLGADNSDSRCQNVRAISTVLDPFAPELPASDLPLIEGFVILTQAASSAK